MCNLKKEEQGNSNIIYYYYKHLVAIIDTMLKNQSILVYMYTSIL